MVCGEAVISSTEYLEVFIINNSNVPLVSFPMIDSHTKAGRLIFSFANQLKEQVSIIERASAERDEDPPYSERGFCRFRESLEYLTVTKFIKGTLLHPYNGAKILSHETENIR